MERFVEQTLISVYPNEYPDKHIKFKVIENKDINDYIKGISDENKFIATKNAPVTAREGVEGEKIKTTLYTEIDKKVYIMNEETATVRTGELGSDIVVKNFNSTSNEEYVVKRDKFLNTYIPNEDGTFTPVPDEREFTRVNENVAIVTAWNSYAYCLKGSYIVTYNADENDFNTVEKGAFESTYTKLKEKTNTKN